MAGEEDRGIKWNFRVTAGTGAPVLACDGNRLCVFMFNEGPSPVRVGNPSGSVSSIGMYLPSGGFLRDEYSDDAVWVQAVGASSGSVSGYIVQGL